MALTTLSGGNCSGWSILGYHYPLLLINFRLSQPVIKADCSGLRFSTHFDATAHRWYRYDDRLQSTNPISSLLRKNHSFSPCHTIAKKRPFLPFPIIGSPFYNNVCSHLDWVRHKTGQQGSLLTGLSTEKTRKMRLKRHSLLHAA